jgi:phosphohistidine phosphatase
MDLIFWRHADADVIHSGQADNDRPLTARGERHALKMAQWLERKLPDTAKIIASPTLRAEQTLLPLGRKFKSRDELQPNGNVEDLLELAKWPNHKQTVLVVTHQPLIGQTIAYLLGIHKQELSIKKCSIWWLRSSISSGSISTQVVTVQTPDML